MEFEIDGKRVRNLDEFLGALSVASDVLVMSRHADQIAQAGVVAPMAELHCPADKKSWARYCLAVLRLDCSTPGIRVMHA